MGRSWRSYQLTTLPTISCPQQRKPSDPDIAVVAEYHGSTEQGMRYKWLHETVDLGVWLKIQATWLQTSVWQSKRNGIIISEEKRERRPGAFLLGSWLSKANFTSDSSRPCFNGTGFGAWASVCKWSFPRGWFLSENECIIRIRVGETFRSLMIFHVLRIVTDHAINTYDCFVRLNGNKYN